MSWKFAVIITLALFVIAIGMGAWISLSGFNRMLAEPVSAWNLERVGDTCSLRFLGENLAVASPGLLSKAAAPVYGWIREKLNSVSESGVTREFIREATSAGQIAKRETADCWLLITDFFSERYRVWTEL